MAYLTLGSGSDAVAQTFASVGKASIRGVRFRSAITPEIVLDSKDLAGKPGAAGEGKPSALMSFIRPAVYIDTPMGTRAIAPFGEPTRNWFPVVAGAAVILAAVGAGTMLRGMRR